MEAIFGQTFRRPEYQQPLWLRALAGLFAVALFLFLMYLVLGFGRTVWTAFLWLPPERRPLAGQLGALAIGTLSLAFRFAMWQYKIYLDPPMRDLVTTPASPWRILRLALSPRPISQGGVVTSVLMWSLFLYHWFYMAWLGSLPPAAWLWLRPISAVSAVLLAVFLNVLLDAVAVALVLGAATAYPFTAPLRVARVARVLPFVRVLLGVGILMTIGALFVFAIRPSMLAEAQQSSLGAVAAALFTQFDTPGSVAQRTLLWFPSVAWFDVLRSTADGPSALLAVSLWRCIVWLLAAGVLTALSLNRAISVPVRAFWHGKADDPLPADVAAGAARGFDPDDVNGPLEAALLRRFGRMGRAVLRLVSASFDAGSVDVHLVRSLKALVLALALGWAAMLTVPALLDQILVLLYRRHLAESDVAAFRTGIAVLCVAGLAFQMLWIWNVVQVIIQGQQNVTARQAQMAGQQRTFRLTQAAPTRGDSRYPLTEIYAVGFSDVVLLPTGYVLLSATVIGLLVLAGGLLLGLPANAMLWAVAVGVPACTEFAFLSTLNTVSNHKDYRRSRLANLFRIALLGTAYTVVAGVLGALVVIVCSAAAEKGQPWVGWLGTVNMIAVFDVALYMLVRWTYVRRRFDAERPDPNSLF